MPSTARRNAYTSLTAGLIGNQQASQEFVINAIAIAPTKQGIDCVNYPTGNNASECMSNAMIRMNQEQANMDAAGQASMFVKAVIPMMNILLVMFYAFSPIIIAVALLSGPNAIKVLGGFIMFGAWTQSWMPISAIINYLIQMQVQYAFADLPTTGFTMSNYMQFYNILAMKIGVASTMLAMVPMISYALLSGSMQAMSQVGSKLSGKDNFDEKPVAPGMDMIAKNNAVLESPAAMQLKRVDGSIGANAVLSSPSNSILGSYETSAVLAQTQKQAEQYKHGKQKTAQEAVTASYDTANTTGRTTQWKKDVANVFKNTEGAGAKFIHQIAEKEATANSMGHDDKETLEAAVGLKVAGFGASAEKVIGTNKQLKEAYERAIANTSADETSRANTREFGTNFAKTLSTENNNTKKFSEGAGFSSALSEYSDASTAYEDATQWSTQAGSSNKQDFDSLGAQFQAKFGPESEQMISGEAKDKKQFQDRFTDIFGQLKTASGITKEDEKPENQNTEKGQMIKKLRVGAMLKALENTNAEGFTNLLGKSNIGGIARNTSGDDQIGARSMEQSLWEAPSPTRGKVDEKASKEKLDKPMSAGVNVTETEAQIAESKRKQEQAKEDEKNHFMQRGAVRDAEKAHAGEAEAAYKMQLQLKGLANEHGDIAGMANVADAIRQWQNFEEEHPYAAAALSALPIGRALKVAAAAAKGVAVRSSSFD